MNQLLKRLRHHHFRKPALIEHGFSLNRTRWHSPHVSGKMVRSRAQIPRIELVWFLELGFLEVVMQEVSRKALPGDFF